jgi:hypothetical protein
MMNLRGEPRKLANFIRKAIEYKFRYELNSNVYLAAAILNVNKLKTWIGRPYSKGFFTNGIESLKIIASRFLLNTNELNNQQNSSESNLLIRTNEQATSPSIISPNTGFEEFSNHFFNSDNATQTQLNIEIKEDEIKKEIKQFRILLSNNNYAFLNEINSSKKFWIENADKFPNLKNLSLILFNINASSAFLERYFSLCGFVSKKNSCNISFDFSIARCLLSSNIKLIKHLNKISY